MAARRDAALNEDAAAVNHERAIGPTGLCPHGHDFGVSTLGQHATDLLPDEFRRGSPQRPFVEPSTRVGALAPKRVIDPSRVPGTVTLRTIGGGFGEPGEDKYMINRYLRERLKGSSEWVEFEATSVARRVATIQRSSVRRARP